MSKKQIAYNFSGEPTGTHMLILEHIAPHSRVLDIGCSRGYIGGYLTKEKGCEVWGIEPDKDSYNEAITKGYHVLANQTIEEALEGDVFRDQQFDYIVIGDVVEHLIDPESVLRMIRRFLNAKGRLILSLPNVAHYSTRLRLLRGQWNMTDSGIMDRTHLHFYTLRTATELLERCGWRVASVRPRGDLERWFRRIGMEHFGKRMIFAFPALFAIQFIFVCYNKES